MIRIWDQWIRLFHWSLVMLVLFLIFSGFTAIGFYDWHRLTGEIVLALLVFRLLWGLVGSENARLHRLLVHPGRAVTHLLALAQRRVSQHRGHNPAGGWAVLLMLSLLLFQAVTGLFIADEDELVEGRFYGLFSSDASLSLLHLHHFNGSVLLPAVILLHVSMPLIYFLLDRQNLLSPMITGKMSWTEQNPPPELTFGSWRRGLVLLALAVGGVGLLVGWIV